MKSLKIEKTLKVCYKEPISNNVNSIPQLNYGGQGIENILGWRGSPDCTLKIMARNVAPESI